MNRRHTIALIVEGQGDELSMPGLVARYFEHRGFYDFAPHPQAICTKTCSRLKAAYDPRDRGVHQKRGIERFVIEALRFRPDGILVLLDGDEECIVRKREKRPGLGAELLERARAVAQNTPISVVVANREFEAWFLAAWPEIQTSEVDCLADELGDDLRAQAESLAGFEGRLSRLLGYKYEKRKHQPMLARHLPFDGDTLYFAPSYHKLLHELDRLVRTVRKREAR